MQGFLDHIVLNIEDEETIIDFYTRVLMLSAERLEDYRADEAPFPSVRINQDTVIDLFPKKLWEQDVSTGRGFRNLNHFCLSLTKKDWEDLHRRLLDNQIPIREGPVQRWGARGTGTSIYFSDPEGNTVEARFYSVDDHEKNVYWIHDRSVGAMIRYCRSSYSRLADSATPSSFTSHRFSSFAFFSVTIRNIINRISPI